MQWVVVLCLMVAYLALRDTPTGDDPKLEEKQAQPEKAREYTAPNEDIAHLLKTLA
jgi:hypothetical protein